MELLHHLKLKTCGIYKDLTLQIWHGRCKTRSNFNGPHPLRNPQFPTNQDLWRYKCFVGITERNKKRNETGVSVGRQAEIGEEDFYNLMSTECIYIFWMMCFCMFLLSFPPVLIMFQKILHVCFKYYAGN